MSASGGAGRGGARILAAGGRWGGYRRTSLAVNRGFNFVLAFLIVVAALPVMGVVCLVILIFDRRPIFYKGDRLGLGKQVFSMYKFRTLVPEAEKIVGAELLSHRHKLVTRAGKFLRDTRLDELPQLFNILGGSMDFVGPRPERPVVYEKICRHIRDYDRRFSVKPGLIGYSQLFTPYSSPKRLRAMIDNTLVRKKQVLMFDAAIVGFTILVVIRTTLRLAGNAIWKAVRLTAARGPHSERRDQERVHPRQGLVWYGAGDRRAGGLDRLAELVDINEEAFLMRSNATIGNPFPMLFKLQVRAGDGRRRGHRHREKSAVCEGVLYRETAREGGAHMYVVKYTPVSPLNYYKVHQYFLCRSAA